MEKTADGRSIWNVPEKKWLLEGEPELEVLCLTCAERIRYHKYIVGEHPAKNRTPRTHWGTCRAIATATRLGKRIAKDKKKRSKT